MQRPFFCALEKLKGDLKLTPSVSVRVTKDVFEAKATFEHLNRSENEHGIVLGKVFKMAENIVFEQHDLTIS